MPDPTPVNETQPRPAMSALFGEARLLDDGHVEFIHDCREGRVTATLPSPPWKVLSEDPLTVQPSVHCASCGWHGWISNGVARQVHVSQMPPASEDQQ